MIADPDSNLNTWNVPILATPLTTPLDPADPIADAYLRLVKARLQSMSHLLKLADESINACNPRLAAQCLCTVARFSTLPRRPPPMPPASSRPDTPTLHAPPSASISSPATPAPLAAPLAHPVPADFPAPASFTARAAAVASLLLALLLMLPAATPSLRSLTRPAAHAPLPLPMTDLNALPLDELYRYLAREGWITRAVELARDEDLGPEWELSGGDVTSRALILAREQARGLIIARNPGVIAGLALVPEILHAFRADADFEPAPGIADGAAVRAGATIGFIAGNRRSMLSAERTVLNFLGRLSGVATRVADHVALIAGSRAKLFDTRKTTPGLRALEKYAVRCGGGCCHRLGLYDAALIKDNHLAGLSLAELPAAVVRSVRLAREEAPREGLRFVELEVDHLDQFQALLKADAVFGPSAVQIVLLDNMSPADLARAVALRDAAGARVLLEASGGITRDNLPAVAATGVDRISLGSLTHAATWLDVALDIESAAR
ncbi:MAG: carboxylating nicotinate-nucleotide diphosphorylase [Phycisphaerales bacterium]